MNTTFGKIFVGAVHGAIFAMLAADIFLYVADASPRANFFGLMGAGISLLVWGFIVGIAMVRMKAWVRWYLLVVVTVSILAFVRFLVAALFDPYDFNTFLTWLQWIVAVAGFVFARLVYVRLLENKNKGMTPISNNPDAPHH